MLWHLVYYFLWNLQFKQPQIKLYNLKDKGSVSLLQLTMILFQMEEVGGGVIWNHRQHPFKRATLIWLAAMMGRPWEGKASLIKRGELAEIKTSISFLLVPLCPGEQGNKVMVINDQMVYLDSADNFEPRDLNSTTISPSRISQVFLGIVAA